MTRQFDPLKAGLSPEAVEQLYNIVLNQKLVLEAKLDRLKREMSIGACAIEDGLVDLDQAKQAMYNFIYYIDLKIPVDLELNADKGTLELISAHSEMVKKQYENRKG